uniref:Uncharacterized protein n=1 Tax=Thermofilum pendens TaxID=2269 RepID=A0A7C4BAJ4_THEPE
MSSLLRRKEVYDAPPRDFLEEHERIAKQVSKPSGQVSQPLQPQQTAYTTLHVQALSQKQGELLTRFEALLQVLRELGFDVKPLEVLREYVKRLDEEEKRLLTEIESRQKTLELVRRAKETLKNFGA